MDKYRIVEKDDGIFYIEQRILWVFWGQVRNIINDQISCSSEKAARSWIDSQLKRERKPKPVKIYKV